MTKSKGLGDDIEKVTKKTGVKKAVDWFSEKTGVDCGCEKRKEKLNKLFSYKRTVNCMTKSQFESWKSLKERYPENELRQIKGEDKELISSLHAELFNHKKSVPCSSCPGVWISWVEDIEKVYEKYEFEKPKSNANTKTKKKRTTKRVHG